MQNRMKYDMNGELKKNQSLFISNPKNFFRSSTISLSKA
jgi:hypothetical protein